MPSVQEQDSDLTSAIALRGQIALPGIAIDEYCLQDVHEAVRRHRPIGWLLVANTDSG